MIYALAILQRCVDLADRLVFGQEHLTKTRIDIRTLFYFISFAASLLMGVAIIGFLDFDLTSTEAIFCIIISIPLACVFIAREQRLKKLK